MKIVTRKKVLTVSLLLAFLLVLVILLVMHIMGEVKGKNAIIVDDLIATGSSLVEAVAALKSAGCNSVGAGISHGILSGPAIERIDACKDLEELVITDSIPLLKEKQHPLIKVLSIAPLLGEAIWGIHREESVSCLFDENR